MDFISTYSEISKLESQAITVWLFKINNLLKHCLKLNSLLSNDERSRSEAFHFKVDSKRYICAHGMLRLLLAYYTASNPVLLKLTSDSTNKPRLADFDNIKFNLSHTKDWIALALAIRREVGIDIEKCIPLANVDDMSRNIMHENELLEYLSLPDFKKNDYFYRCWAKKESVVKAWGTGLYEDLRQIKVMNSIYPYISSKKVTRKNNLVKNWTIEDFDAPAQHFGSVCYEGSLADIKLADETASKPILSVFNLDF